MKLLIGCSSPPDIGAGGILTYTREIVESFLEKGHEIHIAAPEPVNWEWVKDNGLQFIETSQYKSPIKSVSKLLEYVKDNDIEGIINNDNPYVQSILPAVALPSVVIGHLGETVIASLACRNPEWTDYVVAISNDMYSTYVQKYNIPITKCPVVFNGVKDNGCKDNLNNKNDKLKVVFAGGFNKRKGCKKILSAVKNYNNRIENIELNWFGNVSESLKNDLKEYAFVNFPGRVSRNKFVEILADSDVLLFPSKSEGCPMAMLEAMSSGVVPIASNGVGAMSSLIISGKEGYICHLENWDDQATECLSFLDSNRDILNDMKNAVREKFVQQFQATEVTTRLLDLLSKPTVKRDKKPDVIDVLYWHRAVPKGKSKATLINRVRYKLGYLRIAGQLGIRK